jgi:hypothetical protein
MRVVRKVLQEDHRLVAEGDGGDIDPGCARAATRDVVRFRRVDLRERAGEVARSRLWSQPTSAEVCSGHHRVFGVVVSEVTP